MSPLCESFVSADRLDGPETFYPLHVRICAECLLVQLPAYVAGRGHLLRLRLFLVVFGLLGGARPALRRRNDRAARTRARLAGRRGGQQRRVPAAALRRRRDPGGRHRAGRERGRGGAGQGHPDRGRVPRPGDRRRRRRPSYGRADLVAGNNVYAHVPDLLGFTAGLAALVKPTGLVTLEFPHLLRLIERRQYDTIYHEHYQYLSLLTASRALATAGLVVVDVDELSTHGGSLRVHARPARLGRRAVGQRQGGAGGGSRGRAAHGRGPRRLRRGGLRDPARPRLVPARRRGPRAPPWSATARRARATRCSTTAASASDLLAYTVDRSPHKQGKFLPGTHIPIHHPDRIAADRPDFVLVLPWNLRTEITTQLGYVARVGRAAGLPDPGAGGGVTREGRAVLRRPRHADARGRLERAQADEHDRRPAPAVARHALLRRTSGTRTSSSASATAPPRSRSTSCATTRR